MLDGAEVDERAVYQHLAVLRELRTEEDARRDHSEIALPLRRGVADGATHGVRRLFCHLRLQNISS